MGRCDCVVVCSTVAHSLLDPQVVGSKSNREHHYFSHQSASAVSKLKLRLLFIGPLDTTRAYFNVPAGTFVPGEMENVPGDWPSVPGEMGGIGPISSSESALKVTYGNVEGQKNFPPAAGFRPCLCSPKFSLE